MCVWLCVCEREREKERERLSVCVCVCVCVCVSIDLIEDCGLKLDPGDMGLTPPYEVCSHEAIARVVRRHREYQMDPEDFGNATCTHEVRMEHILKRAHSKENTCHMHS